LILGQSARLPESFTACRNLDRFGSSVYFGSDRTLVRMAIGEPLPADETPGGKARVPMFGKE
jgi:hypothetical protein